MKFPNSVTEIGVTAFFVCSSLIDIQVADTNPNYSSEGGVLYNKDKTIILFCCQGKSGNIVIPNSVTEIGDSFNGCSSLTSIEIPNSVTEIGRGAFEGCTSLTSIEIPNSVTEIGERAFKGCSSLTSIEIPNSVTKIGLEAFYGCTSLTSIVIPNSVTEIGYHTFSNCTSLTSVVIPNSVTTIRDSFNGCTGLTSIEIPNSVTEIRWGAFEGCTSLTSIAIPNSVTVIRDGAFEGCTGLTSVVIPDSVTEIGGGAFYGCSSLVDIQVADTNPNYSSEGGVLYNKDKTILLFCCQGKSGNIVIPNSVTEIGGYAFYRCSSLTSIEIPNSVTEIGCHAFCHAFEGCTSLTSIEIPNSVTEIGYGAFSGCKSLTSIVIPNSVTRIVCCAFEGCTSLTSVVIPDSVTEICTEAFNGCKSLTLFEYPSTLKFKKKDVFGYMDTKKIKFEAKKSSIVAELNSVADLKGQVICVSGKFKDHSQEEMEALVTSNGATVSSSVTKKTTVLVTGDKVGATKLTKAQELGIKILSQEEFFNILNGGTNEASAAKGKRAVHVEFGGLTAHSRWNSCPISREQLMAFISEYSDEQLDLDSEEGMERASEILNENIDAAEGAFDCYPDFCDFWNPDSNLTLTVEDGDESLGFGSDELSSVPVSEIEESISENSFIFITCVTAKYPSLEGYIEIEGEFDVAKLSVEAYVKRCLDGKYDYSEPIVMYDGEDIDLELTYDRVIEEYIILKKN